MQLFVKLAFTWNSKLILGKQTIKQSSEPETLCDKYAARYLSHTTKSDCIIKIISPSLLSPNRDLCPCHLFCNIPATSIHPCQLPEPGEIISPHYTAGWSQIHSS